LEKISYSVINDFSTIYILLGFQFAVFLLLTYQSASNIGFGTKTNAVFRRKKKAISSFGILMAP